MLFCLLEGSLQGTDSIHYHATSDFFTYQTLTKQSWIYSWCIQQNWICHSKVRQDQDVSIDWKVVLSAVQSETGISKNYWIPGSSFLDCREKYTNQQAPCGVNHYSVMKYYTCYIVRMTVTRFLNCLRPNLHKIWVFISLLPPYWQHSRRGSGALYTYTIPE